MPNELIHWWAAFSEIRIPAALCGVSPEGQQQAGVAVLARAEWLAAFNNVLGITLVLALVAVFFTYETRVVGHLFLRRWWGGLVLSSLLIAGVCFLYLVLAPVSTAGCQFAQSRVHIPQIFALSRTSVALFQAALAFVVFSWLLTLVARWSRRPRWIANAQIPFRF